MRKVAYACFSPFWVTLGTFGTGGQGFLFEYRGFSPFKNPTRWKSLTKVSFSSPEWSTFQRFLQCCILISVIPRCIRFAIRRTKWRWWQIISNMIVLIKVWSWLIKRNIAYVIHSRYNETQRERTTHRLNQSQTFASS